MPRYRLTLEYDGAPFSGFQSQAGQPTVQDALERAIEAFCGEVVRVAAAGRTDAGVHAAGQVVHFDLARDWPDEVVMNAVNAHLLPAPIAVLDCARVDDGFHARFSAVSRRYLYRIRNRPGRPALEAGRVWHVKAPLDVAAMDEAARNLEGRHDFTTFRDAACQSASPVKTLDLARVERFGEEARLTFEARSFLHRQVRSMTGSLVQVGLGRWSLAELVAALEARDRARCGQVAPACGLTLALVRYPPNVAK
jgi:tRNA pseudouridine38-40 synthase